jgi:hypothetical protein
MKSPAATNSSERKIGILAVVGDEIRTGCYTSVLFELAFFEDLGITQT